MPTKVSTLKALAIRREAEELLAGGGSAAAFSARFFGPEGRLSGLAGSPRERELLVKTDLYRWLQDRLAELRRRDAADFESRVACTRESPPLPLG